MRSKSRKNHGQAYDNQISIFDFIFVIEDQRDWQRRPGCSKNPFSCFFCHLLNVLTDSRVMNYEIHDVTYGIGSFYEKCPNLNVIGVDIVKWDWIVEPKHFIKMDALQYLTQLPQDGRERRIVVIDPPYSTHPTSRSKNSEVLYFNAKQWTRKYLLSVINQAIQKASIVILKYMPVEKEMEIELLRLSRYVIHWRFFRKVIAVNEGNKVIRNATQIYLIW
jgi:hypothetical protein